MNLYQPGVTAGIVIRRLILCALLMAAITAPGKAQRRGSIGATEVAWREFEAQRGGQAEHGWPGWST